MIFNILNVILFRKKLLQHKLIECQSYNQHIDGTNIFGQLIHLPRFSAIFKPRHIVVLERIIEILKSKPNFMAEYQDLKSNFDAHTNSFLRRFFKSSFFQKYVLTDTVSRMNVVFNNNKIIMKMRCVNDRFIFVH